MKLDLNCFDEMLNKGHYSRLMRRLQKWLNIITESLIGVAALLNIISTRVIRTKTTEVGEARCV